MFILSDILKSCGLRTTAVILTSFLLLGCTGERQRIEQAQSQVNSLAEKLDKQTQPNGAYIRVNEGDIKQTDPWGTTLQVVYTAGGLGEDLTVRSAGPDKSFHTSDDVSAVRQVVHMRGIGNSIQEGVRETTKEAAKGAVEGVKEAIKESLPFRKPAANPDAAAPDS